MTHPKSLEEFQPALVKVGENIGHPTTWITSWEAHVVYLLKAAYTLMWYWNVGSGIKTKQVHLFWCVYYTAVIINFTSENICRINFTCRNPPGLSNMDIKATTPPSNEHRISTASGKKVHAPILHPSITPRKHKEIDEALCHQHLFPKNKVSSMLCSPIRGWSKHPSWPKGNVVHFVKHEMSYPSPQR